MPFPAYALAGATGFALSLDGSTQPHRLIATAGREPGQGHEGELFDVAHIRGWSFWDIGGRAGWKKRTLVFWESGMVVPALIVF